MARYRREAIHTLWWRIRQGQADEAEKLAAISAASDEESQRRLEDVRSLVQDESPDVRTEALLAAILHLGWRDAEATGVCWRLLEADADQGVRSAAATGLGSLLHGSRSLSAFDRLAALHAREEDGIVRSSIADALWQIAGKPPQEWPSREVPWRELSDFRVSDVAVQQLRLELK